MTDHPPPFPAPAEANDFLADHLRLLRHSYRRLTGRDLIDPSLSDPDAAKALFDAPFALLSHDTQADPILTYGNRTVLRLFAVTWNQLTRMPSRYTAEAPDRAERARLLHEVRVHGFVDDYRGVRISARGQRFLIEGACVWNLADPQGRSLGQAATFTDWRLLSTEAPDQASEGSIEAVAVRR